MIVTTRVMVDGGFRDVEDDRNGVTVTVRSRTVSLRKRRYVVIEGRIGFLLTK